MLFWDAESFKELLTTSADFSRMRCKAKLTKKETFDSPRSCKTRGRKSGKGDRPQNSVHQLEKERKAISEGYNSICSRICIARFDPGETSLSMCHLVERYCAPVSRVGLFSGDEFFVPWLWRVEIKPEKKSTVHKKEIKLQNRGNRFLTPL